jgi:NhaA family Na+:H+ antiporter
MVLSKDDHPPGAWPRARQLARRALAPVERFLAVEASSGIVLLVSAALALAWANSPWRSSYESVWRLPLDLELGRWSLQADLRFWINDGLMTVFFFVVGLEIRRELHRGELSDLRGAALPLVAAVGGMLVPACIALALNHGRSSARGWGVPMATDIAFAAGVLALLARRTPPAARVLLLALAVIDDIGAIIVIAIFYSGAFGWGGLLVAVGGLAAIGILQLLGVRRPAVYLLPGAAVWLGSYAAGVHPTLAGVALGLLTPPRAWPGREQIAPLDRLEQGLHGWVAFGIMPLFALANAGVSIGQVSLTGDTLLLFVGVALGLMVGKPVGIVGLTWLARRAGIVALSETLSWRAVTVVGMVGGIGFTMALFIAELAFPPGRLLEAAKLAVLTGSTLAAVGGLVLGRLVLRPSP